jgi:glutathione S-transferase
MLTLFYVPRTRSTRARWVLEELGLPYELKRLDPRQGDTRTAEHAARHPLQHVPVLQTDAGFVFESAAICLHLAELAPERALLAPPGTHARALVYQWAFYAMTELEPALVTLATEQRAGRADGEVAREAKGRYAKALAPLELLLGSASYLVGDAFSVADVLMGAVVAWGVRLQASEGLPHVAAWVERLTTRPAYLKATAD